MRACVRNDRKGPLARLVCGRSECSFRYRDKVYALRIEGHRGRRPGTRVASAHRGCGSMGETHAIFTFRRTRLHVSVTACSTRPQRASRSCIPFHRMSGRQSESHRPSLPNPGSNSLPSCVDERRGTKGRRAMHPPRPGRGPVNRKEQNEAGWTSNVAAATAVVSCAVPAEPLKRSTARSAERGRVGGAL